MDAELGRPGGLGGHATLHRGERLQANRERRLYMSAVARALEHDLVQGRLLPAPRDLDMPEFRPAKELRVGYVRLECGAKGFEEPLTAVALVEPDEIHHQRAGKPAQPNLPRDRRGGD